MTSPAHEANYFRFRLSPEVVISAGTRIKTLGRRHAAGNASNWLHTAVPPRESRRMTGCSATRFAATPRCSRATIASRRRGASSTRRSWWPTTPPIASTNPAHGVRARRKRSSRAGRPGTTRRRKRATMLNRTRQLTDLGQSLWLDAISREILDNGTLRDYIERDAITGLTSNPTIFDEAIGNSAAYDDGIRAKARSGHAGEALFTELALEDLRRAADLLRPELRRDRRRRRLGVDGGFAVAGGRHRRQHRRREADPCAGGSAESVREDSGHAGGPAGDRGSDLRRCADQRHAAVLVRAILGRRARPTCAASNAASRRA